VRWNPKSVLGMLLLGAAVAAIVLAIAGGYSGCFTACNPLKWDYGLFGAAQ